MAQKTILLSERERKFVECVVSGMGQMEAYKVAYDKPDATPASASLASKIAGKLAVRNAIRDRLAKVDAEVDKNLVKFKTQWTKEKLIEEFERFKEKCAEETINPVTGRKEFQVAGVIKSLENIGKLMGFYTEKLDVTLRMPNITITKASEAVNAEVINSELVKCDE